MYLFLPLAFLENSPYILYCAWTLHPPKNQSISHTGKCPKSTLSYSQEPEPFSSCRNYDYGPSGAKMEVRLHYYRATMSMKGGGQGGLMET